jgi:hypothetical protein
MACFFSLSPPSTDALRLTQRLFGASGQLGQQAEIVGGRTVPTSAAAHDDHLGADEDEAVVALDSVFATSQAL